MQTRKITRNSLKHCFSASILVLIFLISSCSNSSNPEDSNKQDSTSSGTVKEDSEVTNAAKDVCNCFADFENAISADGKKVLMETANKNAELDIRQLNESDREIFSTKGITAYDCTKALEKKYAFLTDFTPEKEKLYNEALKQSCSEFVVAVMTTK